jgi:adenylylsulfate kinase-like enzyme
VTHRLTNTILILSGPTAAGKNTVGHLVAKQHARCAVIDFDAVRAMFVQPHRAPWEGEEGRAQQQLGIRHVCHIAQGFVTAGWPTIILDVLTDETAALYRQQLPQLSFKVVQLLPCFAEVKRRFDERGPCLTDNELVQVYAGQEAFRAYDLRLDNTVLPVEDAASRISTFWKQAEA